MGAAVQALAHPNIALVKYWGKRDDELNIPATPSLAMTLGGFSTMTRVESAATDVVHLDGEQVDDKKITAWLAAVREQFDVPPLRVESTSDFPAASGLASSASGFAALALAVSTICELEWSQAKLCEWARRGSASAARSVHGGFVVMEPRDSACAVSQVLAAAEWDLNVVVAINAKTRKPIPSTEGMTRARATSSYYDAWLSSTQTAFQEGVEAVKARHFDMLANVAETSCRNLHALMLSSAPPLVYWNETTIKCIEAITQMRLQGLDVFYTIDAGPHVKAVCDVKVAQDVTRRLNEVPGVVEVRLGRIGEGARLLVA